MPVLDHVCWARYSKIYDQIQAYLLSFFVALAALFCRQSALVNVVSAWQCRRQLFVHRNKLLWRVIEVLW